MIHYREIAMSKAFVRLLVAVLALVASPLASAQEYPSRPVRVVVPYPPGGPTDVIVRVIANRLTESLGQPVVVENRAGASGMIGAELVSKAPPDGYTLLVNPSIHVILPSLVAKMPFDAIKDFSHITLLVSVPLFLVVNNSLPVRNVRELIAYAKANPGKLNFASSSSGSSSQLAGEQFKLFAGVEMQHIPYKGSTPALTDVMGGQVQMMFDSTPSAMPFVKSGKLRALAVTTAKRTGAAPDIPSMAEAGLPGFDHSNWYGVWGPPGLPRDVVNKVSAALAATMQKKDVRDRLIDLGADPVDGVTPAQFEAYAQSELARFAKIVKQGGVKIE
jgi:tripartite-type tricarboxylate transporter receptor subunit TctC